MLYSIGHSNHPETKFLDLLQQHQIQVLVDVRSHPFSRFNPQFNQRRLDAALAAAGIRYVFMGDQLGGRPKRADLRDEAGHPLYDRMAQTQEFREGIEFLAHSKTGDRVAIMCSEENPAVCHRHLLIAPVLTDRGIDMQHIRGDGRVQSEADVRVPGRQGTLFPNRD
jgi:uncharacterized protein (DUF488 family)